MVRCEDDRTPGNLDNVLGSNYMWSCMITVDTLVVVHHTAQGAGITYIQSWGSFCNTFTWQSGLQSVLERFLQVNNQVK